MVSAWVHQNRLVLGQVEVSDKSNEITAIPKLLEKLNITGAVVTLDAYGCLKHTTLNLAKSEKSSMVGVKTKRLKAGWDN